MDAGSESKDRHEDRREMHDWLEATGGFLRLKMLGFPLTVHLSQDIARTQWSLST